MGSTRIFTKFGLAVSNHESNLQSNLPLGGVNSHTETYSQHSSLETELESWPELGIKLGSAKGPSTCGTAKITKKNWGFTLDPFAGGGVRTWSPLGYGGALELWKPSIRSMLGMPGKPQLQTNKRLIVTLALFWMSFTWESWYGYERQLKKTWGDSIRRMGMLKTGWLGS